MTKKTRRRIGFAVHAALGASFPLLDIPLWFVVPVLAYGLWQGYDYWESRGEVDKIADNRVKSHPTQA